MESSQIKGSDEQDFSVEKDLDYNGKPIVRNNHSNVTDPSPIPLFNNKKLIASFFLLVGSAASGIAVWLEVSGADKFMMNNSLELLSLALVGCYALWKWNTADFHENRRRSRPEDCIAAARLREGEAAWYAVIAVGMLAYGLYDVISTPQPFETAVTSLVFLSVIALIAVISWFVYCSCCCSAEKPSPEEKAAIEKAEHSEEKSFARLRPLGVLAAVGVITPYMLWKNDLIDFEYALGIGMVAVGALVTHFFYESCFKRSPKYAGPPLGASKGEW